MATAQLQQAPTVDRVQASKLLKVSVRTIDRYIKSGKLAAYQKNGRIWLKRSDVVDMGRGQLVVKNPEAVHTYEDTQVENHSPIRGTGARTAPSVQEISAAMNGAQSLGTTDTHFYKDLYEEAQKRLTEYQRKFDTATERMTDLESQLLKLSAQQISTAVQSGVQNVAPVRHNSGAMEPHEVRFEMELLKKDLAEKDKEVASLKSLLEKEKVNKNAFAIITYTLLALQPVLWYFLH